MDEIKCLALESKLFEISKTKQLLIGLGLAMVLMAWPKTLRAAGPAPVNLGSTANFAILSGAAITSTGGGIINGNVGASPIAGSAIGVTQAQVNGIIYTVDSSGPAGSVNDPTLLTTAKGDLTTAYNDAAGRTPVPSGPFLNPNGGNIGGLNLVPGLYKFTGAALITGASVTLTGGPNDVWIFQIAADLEVGSSVQVILAGGAQAGNVFWQVGTSATIGTFGVFNGTILANQSITLDTSSTMNGRALAFNGGVTFDGLGATLPTPLNPGQGSLQVNLSPPGAVIAGAQWQVDGGSNQNSGVTLTNVSPGSHIVSFAPIAGWINPANQTAIVTTGQTTTNTGLYALNGTAPAGSLTVDLLPAGAVTAGAQWRVDGGPPENSGATVANLGAGNHLVAFTTVAGWITPSNLTVTITNATTTTAPVAYVAAGPGLFGSLTVNLLPAGAVTGGAQWQVDSGANQNSGVTISNLLPGNYSVSFVPIFGWITPADQIASVTNGEVTTNTGLYVATNSFIFAEGRYNGLFSETNGVTEQTAGMLKSLSLGTNGTYSGTILIKGGSRVVRGVFNALGLAENSISRPAGQGGPLTLEMKLNVNQPLPQVTGAVLGTNNGASWMAALLADLATNIAPAAEFTMLLPPDTNNQPPTMSPGGASYFLITNYTGTAKNPASATIKITGAMADGTSFNQSVPVSGDGYVPLYASLYGGKGLLLGWINLDSTNAVGVSLTWIHPARASGLYRNGFTNVILTNQILLSSWVYPGANAGLLTDLSARDTLDDPIALSNYTLTIGPGLSFHNAAGTPVISGSINRKTGFFKVTIGSPVPVGPVMNGNSGNVLKGNEGVLPDGGVGPLTSFDGTPLHSSAGVILTGYGAILQNATNGGGYFLTRDNAQAILLQP